MYLLRHIPVSSLVPAISVGAGPLSAVVVTSTMGASRSMTVGADTSFGDGDGGEMSEIDSEVYN